MFTEIETRTFQLSISGSRWTPEQYAVHEVTPEGELINPRYFSDCEVARAYLRNIDRD